MFDRSKFEVSLCIWFVCHSLLFLSSHCLSWYSIYHNCRTKCCFSWSSFGFWSYSYCSEGKNFVLKLMHYFKFELWAGAFLRFIRKSNMHWLIGKMTQLFSSWRFFRFDTTHSCDATGFNTINGLKFSGTGSCARNSCWDIADWCSCWWCGGNWKCVPIWSWRLSRLVLYLFISESDKTIVFFNWVTNVFSEHDEEAICNRMVLVCGTSTCHMAVSRSKLFIPGIWGPFWSGRLLFSPFYQVNLNSVCHCTSFFCDIWSYCCICTVYCG